MIWSGLPLSTEEALSLYDVDAVLTTPSIASLSSASIYAIENQISTSITASDTTLLKLAIEECRAIKDIYEVALIKKANVISALAHTEALKRVKSVKNEREIEAVFLERCIANGCREQAYSSIVASGTAAATLHYVDNAKPLDGKLNLLLDAGGEYGLYAADIVGPSFSYTLII